MNSQIIYKIKQIAPHQMKFFSCLLLILTSILMTSCVSPTASILPEKNVQDINPRTDFKPFIYRFGVGDTVRVNVYQEKDLSGKFEIDSRGIISLPYIQDIKAAGLSARELSQHIAATFVKKNILRDPKVSVEILDYRPFYIQGEVNKGGEYPYKSNMDIRNAVAVAGGYTYRAEQSIAMVRREGNDKILRVDLSKGNFPVYPGDSIEIPERFF